MRAGAGLFEFDYDYELLNVSARALGARAV
jgi:hypothetical protein